MGGISLKGGAVGIITVNSKLVVFTSASAMPFTVIVYVPTGVDGAAIIVRTEVHVGLQEVGEKDAVAPVGRPEAENETDSEVPDRRVAVTIVVVD